MKTIKSQYLSFAKGDILFKIIGENGYYPNADDCYIIEITDRKTGTSYINYHFPKVEYNLYLQLEKYWLLNPVRKDFEKLISCMEDYWDYKYERAMIDESFNNEDI